MDFWGDILRGLKGVTGEKPSDDPMDFNKLPPIQPTPPQPVDLSRGRR